MRKLPGEIQEENQEGQALLILLLVMAVVLTVVLSVVSRSITDITTTTYEEESLRAFSAAEAGVEETLKQGTAPPETNLGNASYEVSTSTPSPSNDEFVYPSELFGGETATFWFVSHRDSDFSLTCDGGASCLRSNQINRLCWGSPGATNIPAVELSVVYDENRSGVYAGGDFSGVRIARATYDADSTRSSINGFTYASGGTCNIGNQTFAYSMNNINLSGLGATCSNQEGCLLMAKVRMLYNQNESQPAGIQMQTAGGTTLPPQGVAIDSTGQAGDSTRKVKVFHSYPELPFAFNSAVFSLLNLEK